MRERTKGPVTIARLEAALKTVATAVLLHGPVYAPIMDRLEAELAEARRSAEAPDRARAILERLSA